MGKKIVNYKKPVVVCDVDGVVADWFFTATKDLKKLFGVPEYPKSNYEATAWGLGWLGLTQEHEDQLWVEILNNPFWWEQLREMEPGIVSRMFDASQGTVWYWCTTRNDCITKSAQEQTKDWLHNNHFYDPNVVVSGEKGAFCKAVKADIFIDDKYENCAKVKAENPDTHVIFICLPYQREFLTNAVTSGMTVVDHVDRVFKYIDEVKTANSN